MVDDLQPDEDDEEPGGVGGSHGKVAFAQIEALTLGALAPAEALRSALVPGTRIERNGRVWLMGQISPVSSSLMGRIGFQAGGPTELWDETVSDFREEFLPAGTTSLFAIDPYAMRVAFQLRPGLIRVKSFTGALQALLDAASPTERWRVHEVLEQLSFEDWVREVGRVSQLRVKLRKPNPHYGDRGRVKELVEGANARMATVVWQADPEDLQGLDLGEPFVQEAIEHTKKYGRFQARGLRNGQPSRWDSDQEAASRTVNLDADPETKEVDPTELRQVIGDLGLPPDPNEYPDL